MRKQRVSVWAAVAAVTALFLAFSPAWTGNSSREKARSGSRAFLGVELEEETEYAEGGARILDVVDDSAAERAGLREDDIVVSINGRTVRGPAGLGERLRELAPGDRVTLGIVRDGRSQTVSAELGERPRPRVWVRHEPSRPRLGVEIVTTTPELREHLGSDAERGVLVGRVIEDSPAERGGIEVGDLIVGVDGVAIEDIGDLREALEDGAGTTISIEVVREKRKRSVSVELPEAELEAWDDAELTPWMVTPAPPPAYARSVAPPAPPTPPPAPRAWAGVSIPAPPAPPSPPVPPVPAAPAARGVTWM